MRRTRRNQRGGLFGWFGPSASTLHQIIRNNNDNALGPFLAKLSEEKKKELINTVIGGETAMSLAKKGQMGMEPNEAIQAMLKPYSQSGGRRTRRRVRKLRGRKS